MATVVLRGGLGNQMFQYAAGLAVAQKSGAPLFLDVTYLNDRLPRRQFTFRTYDLDVFDLVPRFTALSKFSTKMPIPGVWLGMDLGLMKIQDTLGLKKIVREKKEFVFDETVLNAGKDAILWGYWQTPKYFEEIENELRSAFHFRYPLQSEAAHIAEDIKKSNAVSLHVRRADYVAPKYQSTYGATNLFYYDLAVRYIADRVKNPKFYVFSDDIAWCKENIKLSFPVEYIERSSEGFKASGHLELMSLCQHNIIANSTFSWWGAWLNSHPDKIVVAPKQWRVAQGSENDEIVPGQWIKL